MIIGLHGLIGSGKDTFAKFWQYAAYYNHHKKYPSKMKVMEFHEWNKMTGYVNVTYNWEIKKWAGYLKQIASLMLGISVEMFEDQEFKKTELDYRWSAWFVYSPRLQKNIAGPYTIDTEAKNWWESHKYSIEDECQVLFKAMTVREFLQKLGTNAVRDHLHPNAWVNSLMKDYKEFPSVEKGEHWQGHAIMFDIQRGIQYPQWLISDTRFPNEARAVKNTNGFVFQIVRYPETIIRSSGTSESLEIPFDKDNSQHIQLWKGEIMKMHESERSLIDWPFDEVIDNSGTLENLCNIAISLHSKYIVL